MEKIIKPVSGYFALLLSIIALLSGVAIIVFASKTPLTIVTAILLLATSIFLIKGIMIVEPNHSRVCVFFGKYVGTVKENGLLWVNPLYTTHKISLRAQNLNGQQLKVNDKMGNPIEIAAVIVWQVSDTYKAAFEVAAFQHYVEVQSEAAVRHLATSCPYDEMEDETADITLRNGGDRVNELLEQELNERLFAAGIKVTKQESAIWHMLRK